MARRLMTLGRWTSLHVGYAQPTVWMLMHIQASAKTRALTIVLWALWVAGAMTAAAQVERPEPATVVVWNRPIAVFRTRVGGLSPSQRASAAARRIESRPEERVPVLSDLHAQIQDAFNEFG